MRYAFLAAAASALCSLPVIAQATAKGDWDIGCEASDKCSYYQHGNVEYSHLTRRDGAEDTEDSDDLDADGPIPDWEYFDTRCKPDTVGRENIVERFNGTHWIDFYNCPTLCADLQGRGACRQESNVWVVPGKYLLTTYKCNSNGRRVTCVKTGEKKRSKTSLLMHKHDSDDSSTLLPSRDSMDPTQKDLQKAFGSGDIQTRCDPADSDKKRVQYLDAGNWHWFYRCQETCVPFPKFAGCRERENKFIVPGPSSTFPNSGPVAVAPPRPHKSDPTRCDPESASNVQRFDGQHWVHSYACANPGACEDVDGHAYCHGYFPSRSATTCGKGNESEVVQWNGRSWDYYGVCLPPYVCDKAAIGVDSAVCKHPQDAKEIWLPWPYLPSNGFGDAITLCLGTNDLYYLKGQTWSHYRYCGVGFICKLMMDASGVMQAGCVVRGSLVARVAQGRHTRRNLAISEDPDHYEPFGFDHPANIPQHLDPGLIENTERLLYQGEGLIEEGKDLVDHGDALYESLYGSGSHLASSREGNSSPKHKSSLDHDSADSFRRRDEEGLVHDSINMRRQGERLVVEGTALVEQGRKLLHTIFGDKTDEVVNSMTDSKSTAATKASQSQKTVAGFKARHLDLRNRDDNHVDTHAFCQQACRCGVFPSEKCDIQCRKCLLSRIGGVASRQEHQVRGECEECRRQCGVLDLECLANCKDECIEIGDRVDDRLVIKSCVECDSCSKLDLKCLAICVDDCEDINLGRADQP
jgi:hypothetical protein